MYYVVDLHCDTIPNMYSALREGKEISLLSNSMKIDLKKMKAGNYMCQCFSLFTHLGALRARGETPFEHVSKLADYWKAQIAQYPSLIGQVTSCEEIIKNSTEGKLSAMMTVEEGGVYEGKLENLYALYEKGVRMSTLTWNYKNELGFPNPADEKGKPRIPDFANGLTDTGKSFVEEMERIGMLIDVSHLNDAGIRDVLGITKGPIIASHSNARGICSHLRNLTDENVRDIGERGGIIGINYLVDFLEDNAETGRIDQMIEHMKYIKNLAGIDAIALGSDFDGFGEPCELTGADKVQLLAERMEKRGFTENEISKVFYKNALRVFRDVLK